MARKSFKGGLDSLFKGSGIKKDEAENEKTELSEKEQHWLQTKISRLEKELKLWRTGKLSPEIFLKSLTDSNLEYDANNNEIVKK